jgi:hypothetical protein
MRYSYKFRSTVSNAYAGAKQKCIDDGLGFLTSINSLEEHTYLKDQCSTKYPSK